MNNELIVVGDIFVIEKKLFKAVLDKSCELCEFRINGNNGMSHLCELAPKCKDVNTGEELSYVLEMVNK